MTRRRTDIILAEKDGDILALVGALESSDATIRSSALGALDRLESLPDEQVVRALSDSDARVRCRAVEVAVSRPALDLLAFLDDQDDLVVETTAWALGERGDGDNATISALSQVAEDHKVSICREASIAALGAIGARKGLPAILRGMSDRAPVRRRAVLALAPFDSEEVTAALQAALHDRDRQVRQAAEDLLG